MVTGAAPTGEYDPEDIRDVAAGVRLLERQAPGWWRRVDPAKLDMWHPNLCVTGQLYGHHMTGYRQLGVAFPRVYGFAAADGAHAERLRQLWVMTIEWMRAAGTGTVTRPPGLAPGYPRLMGGNQPRGGLPPS